MTSIKGLILLYIHTLKLINPNKRVLIRILITTDANVHKKKKQKYIFILVHTTFISSL